MHLGFGIYRHQLDRDHLRFARQCGATHVVLHYVDYFRRGGGENATGNQPTGGLRGWGIAGDPDRLWTTEELVAARELVESEGLRLDAIENFDPAHWHDVLLGGPKKAAQLEGLCELVRRVGAAGIPNFGYNFSLAGVYGRTAAPVARGGAESVGLDGTMDHTPMPRGMVWNMIYDAALADDPETGPDPRALCTHEELWERLGDFLDAVVPAAEAAGVCLAAHPDDPPLPTVRGTPRLVYRQELYQRLLDRHPSPSNGLEFCLGTLAEMAEGSLYETVERYAAQGRIRYVHFRNVRGRVPRYWETFVDEGDIDMRRVLRILRSHGFRGVLIPDHTPLMTCAAPWHAGMAFACGWMRAALDALE